MLVAENFRWFFAKYFEIRIGERTDKKTLDIEQGSGLFSRVAGDQGEKSETSVLLYSPVLHSYSHCTPIVLPCTPPYAHCTLGVWESRFFPLAGTNNFSQTYRKIAPYHPPYLESPADIEKIGGTNPLPHQEPWTHISRDSRKEWIRAFRDLPRLSSVYPYRKLKPFQF